MMDLKLLLGNHDVKRSNRLCEPIQRHTLLSSCPTNRLVYVTERAIAPFGTTLLKVYAVAVLWFIDLDESMR